MASIYARGNRLWSSLKDESGKWVKRPTPYDVGQEDLARRYLKRKQERIDEKRQGESGPMTVTRYAAKWIEARKGRVTTWSDEDARLRLHVVPTLGPLPLADVRPRHVRDLVLALRAKVKEDGTPALAPRTIRHTYQTLRRMMRSAQIEELIVANPVEVDGGILPPNVDKDPAWRATAVYSRKEVVTLLCDERIPQGRRVFYALQAIAGLRTSEARRLRWRDYERDMEPLGRLLVLKTKTKIPRQAPVHPVLAAMLAEWKLATSPGGDDFIVPRWEKTWHVTRDRKLDLKAVGIRYRRGHDLRRTMISLAREDGARADLLEIVTHGAKAGDMISLYSTFPWRVLCDEVAKLKIARTVASDVAHLEQPLSTVLVQSGKS